MKNIVYYILLKNITKNTQHICNTTPIPFDDIELALLDLAEQIANDIDHPVQTSIISTASVPYCEMVNYSEITKPGWIWSSTEQISEVLYLLTAIPVHKDYSLVPPETHKIALQTETSSHELIVPRATPTLENKLQQALYIELRDKLSISNFGLKQRHKID